MVGVGYRAAVSGSNLTLNLGFSHPVEMPIPKGLAVKVEKNTTIEVGAERGGGGGGGRCRGPGRISSA